MTLLPLSDLINQPGRRSPGRAPRRSPVTRLATTLFVGAVVAASVAASGSAFAQTAGTSTLRMVPAGDLKILDPMFTTAYVTRNFAYMVYDTLFAMNTKGVPQPEMVEKYTKSSDGKLWTFTLRKGLKFSDGTPVTSADAIASLERWAARDNVGQAMLAAGGKWQAVDAGTFTLTLQQPFGLVLEGLAKVSSYPAFIIPARLAKLGADKPLNDVVGSGPYLFKRDEWVPGSKIVFVRNPDYVGPTSAPDGLSGNKRPHLDRVEWDVLPDSNSAVAALKNNEVDLMQQAPSDYIQPLRQDTNIKVGVLSSSQAYLIVNQAFPPFDNVKARQALMHVIDQNKFTSAMGFPDDLRVKYCATMFICGSSNATDAGSAPYKTPDLKAAKALLAESGYKGEKVVVLLPTDLAYLNSATLVAVQAMQQLGMNVDVQSMDWATETARRSRKVPPAQGGWNVFLSSASEFNVDSPLANTYLGARCGNGLPGWPCDAKLDQLRDEWIKASDPADKKKWLDAFQTEAYATLPYLPIGQISDAYAARKSLKHLDLLWGLPNVWVLDK